MTSKPALSAALADRYTIIRQIGQGGMALVYLAEDVKHERKVALKVLLPELAAVVGADRFLKEVKTTANLQRSNRRRADSARLYIQGSSADGP